MCDNQPTSGESQSNEGWVSPKNRFICRLKFNPFYLHCDGSILSSSPSLVTWPSEKCQFWVIARNNLNELTLGWNFMTNCRQSSSIKGEQFLYAGMRGSCQSTFWFFRVGIVTHRYLEEFKVWCSHVIEVTSLFENKTRLLLFWESRQVIRWSSPIHEKDLWVGLHIDVIYASVGVLFRSLQENLSFNRVA